MQKLCCVRTRQRPLPVWSHKFVISSLTHFSTNSRPFLVGIVSKTIAQIKCTNESHKQITQNDHGRHDDVMYKNGNDEQHFWMLQSNSGAYGGPETG